MRAEVQRVEADLGELLGSRALRKSGVHDYTGFADDPVGFLRDVLHADPWEKQVEIARAVVKHPLVTVRSCHASGKDWLGARLALWWAYARQGLVLLTGPTASQVEEILMRGEIRRAFVAAKLPGDLHVRALRPGVGKGLILAKTANGVSALTGYHDEEVLFVVTEAQDPDLEVAFDAGFACTTGDQDRMLTLGNPTEPDGRFFAAHQAASGWHSIRIAASDIPNVVEGRTVVPGLLTKEGVGRFVREYGEASPVVQSRVHAQFPSDSTMGLVQRQWLQAAVDRWREGDLAPDTWTVLGVDPARLGPDRTAVCIRQGGVVQRFEVWRGADTMETAEKIFGLVSSLLDEVGPVGTVYVDEVGLGGGVLDRLKRTLPDLRFHYYDGLDTSRPQVRSGSVAARGFIAGARAGFPARFANFRAQGFWHLRKLLEDGRIALPPNEGLLEELLATRVRFLPDGRTAIESKDAIQNRLGRSPDLADALVISLTPELPHTNRKRVRFA
jgi:hypothetical protein